MSTLFNINLTTQTVSPTHALYGDIADNSNSKYGSDFFWSENIYYITVVHMPASVRLNLSFGLSKIVTC